MLEQGIQASSHAPDLTPLNINRELRLGLMETGARHDAQVRYPGKIGWSSAMLSPIFKVSFALMGSPSAPCDQWAIYTAKWTSGAPLVP